jgi:hypothetical protein
MLEDVPPALRSAIDAVDWSQLKHAYGSADDIPSLILEVLSEDAEAAHAAISQVYHSVYHQDLLEPMAPSVVPLLLELLNTDRARVRPYILRVLATFAAEFAHTAGFPEWTLRRTPERLAQGEPAESVAVAQRMWTAVRKGLPLYLRLLTDSEAALRAQAGRAVAVVAGEDVAACMSALKQAWASESDFVVRASQLITLGVCAHDTGHAETLAMCRELLQGGEPLQQSAAAIACAYLGAGTPDESMWQGMRLAGTQGRLNHEVFPWAEGAVPILAAEGLMRWASFARPRVVELLLASLRFQALEGEEHSADVPFDWTLPIGVAEFAVRLVFPFRAPNSAHLLREELSKDQILVLRALSTLNRRPMSLYDLGIRFGGASLRRFLGDDPPGPLDASLTMEPHGQRVSRPIWFWLDRLYQRQLKEDELLAALTAQLPPQDVFKVAQDLTAGFYNRSAMSAQAANPLSLKLVDRIRPNIQNECAQYAAAILADNNAPAAAVALAQHCLKPSSAGR